MDTNNILEVEQLVLRGLMEHRELEEATDTETIIEWRRNSAEPTALPEELPAEALHPLTSLPPASTVRLFIDNKELVCRDIQWQEDVRTELRAHSQIGGKMDIISLGSNPVAAALGQKVGSNLTQLPPFDLTVRRYNPNGPDRDFRLQSVRVISRHNGVLPVVTYAFTAESELDMDLWASQLEEALANKSAEVDSNT
jgi:hypothetical protein